MIPVLGQVTALAIGFTELADKFHSEYRLCFKFKMIHLYRDHNGYKCYISIMQVWNLHSIICNIFYTV